MLTFIITIFSSLLAQILNNRHLLSSFADLEYKEQKNYMERQEVQKRLDSLSAKFGVDKQYTRKFFNDYDFARVEAARAGLEMTKHLYNQLSESFKKLQSPSVKARTFEKVWQDSIYKSNIHGKRYGKLLAISVGLSFVVGFALVLRHLSKG